MENREKNRDIWNTLNKFNKIHISGLLKGKERQNGVQVMLEVIAENFPQAMKDIILQSQEMLWIPS